MQFNSLIFAAFAVVFFLVWHRARRGPELRWATLTIASFVFYGWWDWRFLFLILGSGLLDYSVGLLMERHPERRRLLLGASLLGNLGSLGTFKYLTFASESLNSALAGTGLSTSVPVLQLTLPVGISFYTFQSMSYTIDIYRGQLRPTRNVLHFFAYLAMFPQLVAGPIIRARDLLPQLAEDRPVTAKDRWEGLVLVAHGYFKKIVIADNLAPTVNAAFGAGTLEGSGLYWWVIVSMFAFQIYCDFSGYTDIARGLARWMGFDFARNFDHPYVSTSLREFWTRWHISLSTWFRDYVYIPLGGNRRGPVIADRNMWTTMVLSGLWHGAAWTFITWGALHAAFLSLERVTGWRERLGESAPARALATLLVLLQVWVAWVFFRAETFSQATEILGMMFSPSTFEVAPLAGLEPVALFALGMIVARELAVALGVDRSGWSRSPIRVALEPVTVAAMLAACILLRGTGGEFIYFQF